MMTTERDFLHPHLLTLPIHRAMLRAVEARLFAELAPELPEQIVDIGSGDGTFVEIALPGKKVVGIDPIHSDTHEVASRAICSELRCSIRSGWMAAATGAGSTSSRTTSTRSARRIGARALRRPGW